MNNRTKSIKNKNSMTLKPMTRFQEYFRIQTTRNRRAAEKLDLLLLAIEATDINASVALFSTSNYTEINHIFPNIVEVWKSRCHNPMRRSARCAPLTQDRFEALILLLSTLSQRF